MNNILIVVDSLDIGGIETSLINMLNYISEQENYNITLLPLVRGGKLEKEVPDKIKIIEIDKRKQKYLMPIREKIRKRNILFFLGLIKYMKKNNNIPIGESIRYNIIKSLEEDRNFYDLAISYTDSASLFYVTEKVKANKKIAWVHMDYTNTNSRPILYNSFFEKMDRIVCVSEKVKKSFDSINPKLQEKTEIIHNLMNFKKIEKLKYESVSEFDNNYFNIVTVGRLSKEKNFVTLIRAYKESLKYLNKSTRLYIIGNGNEYEDLKNEIKDLNITDKCFLIGEKINPYKYMNFCDLYVQTSIKEGFGMTLYEAIYLNKPILTTPVSVTYELLQNDVNAIIIDNDISSISAGLIKIINNDDIRNKISENTKMISMLDDENKILKITKGK